MKNVCEVVFRSNGIQQSSFKHLLLLAGAMGWVLSAPMALGQELIANGGFESPGGNGIPPTGWNLIENSMWP